MRSTRLLTIAGLASIVATGVTFQACGGDSEVSLPDAGSDVYVPGNDSDLPDTFVPPPDDASNVDGTADAAPVDAGALCLSTPCIVGLAVGGRHACALAKDGTVRCWGENQQGQLGNGVPDAAFVGTNQPTPVTIASLSNVAAIGASSYYNVYGSTCARTGSNTELCWGSNGGGQLGLSADAGVTDNLAHPIPGLVQGMPSASGGPSPGNFNSCAISGSDLICWGTNAGGVLGRGSVNPAIGAAGKATAIEAGVLQGSPGYDYTLALLADGTVLSWGNNTTGQLGRITGGADIVPKPVATLTGVTQVSAGLAHACAVNGAGAIYCWGDNAYGQVGQGTTSNQPVTVPVVVPMPGAKKATQVSCANYHSCALMTDGSVACWGRNNSGQSGGFTGDAGDAATNPLPVSTAVEMKLSGKALAVGAGGANANTPTGYACALIEGGSVQCWGYNADGELGRGDAGSQNCAGGPCIVTPGNVSFP